MARQTDSEITGTFDNIIFYERNGDFLIRTVQKQTEATEKAAKNFGSASNKAKILRQLLHALLPNPKDRNMQNRLTPVMREFLALMTDRKTISPDDNPLAGFRFVESSDLKDCLQFSLGLSHQPEGGIVVEIPEINPSHSIAAPVGTSRVQLDLMAVGFGMNDELTFQGNLKMISIPYADEMQPSINQIVEIDAQSGSILVVAAALSYWNYNRQISQLGFMPVEVAAVFKQ